MSHVEDMKKAFGLFERYELYRLKRTWGEMLVLIGLGSLSVLILFPISFIIYNFLLVGVALYVAVRYFSVRRIVKEEEKLSLKRDIYFGLALISMVILHHVMLDMLLLLVFGHFFTSFANIRFHLFYPLMGAISSFFLYSSLLLFPAFAYLLSYVLLEKRVADFNELLLTGLILFVGSLIAGIVGGLFFSLSSGLSIFLFPVMLFEMLMLIGSQIICGVYQIKTALRMLEDAVYL
ncbi:MAG: hypothetical protein ACFFDI_16600 [Promethearchaeota archaeon]